MTYGPIDFIVLEFEGTKPKLEVLAELQELVEQKILRIIDLVVVLKDANGEIHVREVQQLENEYLSIFDPTDLTATGMMTVNDIEFVSKELANDRTAAVLLIENLWAVGFKDAVIEADGQLLMQERIPHEVVLEELVDMANFDESAVPLDTE